MLVLLESSSAVLVMIRSKSVSICNRFHARWANSGKITISKGVPLFDALVRGESPHPAAPKLPHWKLETLGYDTVKTRSLYLTWAWFGTGSWYPRQTDRIAIANTRYSSTCRYSCGAWKWLYCWCRVKNVKLVVAIQKANESGCRFGQWRHGHRLVRDQWPVAVNRPLATSSIRWWSTQL